MGTCRWSRKVAAMLKFGYDETNEVFVNSRNVAYGNNKTIARTLDQPWFELVAILFGAQMIGLCRTGRRQPFHSAHMRPHGPRPVSLALPIRSEGCRRLRARLPQRVFQREYFDLHANPARQAHRQRRP